MRTAVNDDDLFESLQGSSPSVSDRNVRLLPAENATGSRKGKMSNLELATKVEYLAKQRLFEIINAFYYERIGLQKLVHEKNNIVQRDTRMIKSEVLSMADRVEHM